MKDLREAISAESLGCCTNRFAEILRLRLRMTATQRIARKSTVSLDKERLSTSMTITPPKIEIGSFTVAFLTDGLWRNDGGCMLGVVPRELWKREHPPDEQNRIRLNLTCPLIIRGRDAILVDMRNRQPPERRSSAKSSP